MEINDHALIQGFNDGEEKAFKSIYEHFYPGLLLTCFRMIRPAGNYEDAKEIVSDVLWDLFKRRGNFPSIKTVKAFLYLAVRHDSIDFLRKKNRVVEIPHDLADLPGINDVLDVDLIDRILEEERVLKSVRELPERSREVVILYYLKGMKYKEIAKLLKISPRTVENQLRYALDKLRNALADKKMVTAGSLIALSLISALTGPQLLVFVLCISEMFLNF